MKSLLSLFDRALQVRQNVLRLRAARSVWWFALRVRARGWLAGARVTIHARAFGTQIRGGVRVRVRRGARINLLLGPWVSLERGTRLDLGTGTLYLGAGTSLGPRASLEVDAGGAVIASPGSSIGVGCVVSAVDRDVELRPDARLGDYAVAGLRGGGSVHVGRAADVGPRTILLGGATVADEAAVPAHAVVEEAFGRPRAAPRGRGPVPEVSVVVSTKDRAQYLPRLFSALEAQRIPPRRLELVVVDDGSSDDTPEVLEALASGAPFEVRVVRRERSGGPAAGRNAGWRAARAPVVAFTDDDCQPSPEWLAAALARMRSDDADIVQGRTLPDPRQEAAGGVFVITNRVERPGGHYETCNILYRRDVLEELGGFDERFPYPMAEDTDLALRALERGRRASFEPEALLFHDVRTVGWRGILRRGRNLSSHALLVRKHPSMRRTYFRRYFIKSTHLYLLVAAAGSIAAAVWTPWALLALAPYVLARLFEREAPLSLWRRIASIPAWIAIDAVEMGSLAAASVRQRRVLL